jgi:hypothetical protein
MAVHFRQIFLSFGRSGCCTDASCFPIPSLLWLLVARAFLDCVCKGRSQRVRPRATEGVGAFGHAEVAQFGRELHEGGQKG